MAYERSLFERRIAFTRYSWWRDDAGGWAIRDGVSLFLIAEGSAYSIRIGRELYRKLTTNPKR